MTVPDEPRPLPVNPRTPDDFVAMYATTPPWDIGRPQPAFVALAEAGQVRGRVLDVGCGTGEHALMAAELGLEAVGVDPARIAIERAEVKAAERHLSARFVVGDALDTATMGQLGSFDTVLDSGVFHIFDDTDRPRFVDRLAEVVASGGRYFLLCFSDLTPGDWGPRRVTPDEIRSSFGDGWRVDSIEASRLVLTFVPDGVYAWLASITRT